MIEAVYAEAHKKNCSRVYWLTQETNYQARILYDQVAINTGFIQYRKKSSLKIKNVALNVRISHNSYYFNLSKINYINLRRTKLLEPNTK